MSSGWLCLICAWIRFSPVRETSGHQGGLVSPSSPLFFRTLQGKVFHTDVFEATFPSGPNLFGPTEAESEASFFVPYAWQGFLRWAAVMIGSSPTRVDFSSKRSKNDKMEQKKGTDEKSWYERKIFLKISNKDERLTFELSCCIAFTRPCVLS